MNRVLTILLFAITLTVEPAWSDEISYTLSVSEPYGQPECWPAYSCPPLLFQIPQFNGTLSEIDFSYSGTQRVTWGFDDAWDPQPGSPYTAAITAGLMANLLPLTASSTLTMQGIAGGSGLISYDASPYWTPPISTSGSDSDAQDLALFEGTGNVDLLLQPFDHIVMTEADGFISSAVVGFQESGTLTISYVDPDPIPEPRFSFLLLGLLLGLFSLIRRQCVSTPE